MDPSKNKAILTKAFETDEMRDSLYQVTFRGEKEGETERGKEREWESERERDRETEREREKWDVLNMLLILTMKLE